MQAMTADPRVSVSPVLLLVLALLAATPRAAGAQAAALPEISCSPSELAGSGLTGPPRLLPGMGSHHFPITTRNAEAQRFFDQGLVLGWGFNFAEAARSFAQAARLDPQCAMCRWGIAWARGPSVNHDMSAADAMAAWEAIAIAGALARNATPREQALVAALGTRYAPRADAPREPLDEAYAQAMRGLARRYPEDADILTLAAEALMVPRGRDYWTRDGHPLPWTGEIAALAARAMALAPEHPGANHYWIHLHEFGPQPERALAAAERMGALAPGVGHLVHMPAHTFMRLGRYDDAVEANRRAAAADLAYLRAAGADPEYAAGYVVHNYHFLWSAALMAGNREAALQAAAILAGAAEVQDLSGPRGATLQHFRVLPLLTQVRFGLWRGILDAPPPDGETAYMRGVRAWARGMAFARTGRVKDAKSALRVAKAALRVPELKRLEFKNANSLAALLAVAVELLRAEVAMAAGDGNAAVAHARAAVAEEEKLAPDEPPAWGLPARQYLGAVLLEAGRREEARRAFSKDLEANPGNGWSLAGLAASGDGAKAAGPRPAGTGFPPGRY